MSTLMSSERLTAHNAARRKAKLPEQTPEQIVEEYISLLTQYNKVKDAAQVVFDKVSGSPLIRKQRGMDTDGVRLLRDRSPTSNSCPRRISMRNMALASLLLRAETGTRFMLVRSSDRTHPLVSHSQSASHHRNRP